MTHYHFVNTWKIQGSLADVWNLISEVDKWPEWWPAEENGYLKKQVNSFW